MPRFYFDLLSDTINIPSIYDHNGKSFPDIEEARKHAIIVAQEFMRSRQNRGGAGIAGEETKWSVAVSNGRFERVFTIPCATFCPPAQPFRQIADGADRA